MNVLSHLPGLLACIALSGCGGSENSNYIEPPIVARATSSACVTITIFDPKKYSSFPDLSHLELKCTKFDQLTLNYVDFSGSVLDGSSFISAKLRGAKFQDVLGRDIDLSFADLSNANLKRANFSRSTFNNAILKGVNASRGVFVSSQFKSATLLFSDLTYSHFNNANLEAADLRSADLSAATIECSNLTGADFRGSLQEYLSTTFSNPVSAFGVEKAAATPRILNDISNGVTWTGFKYNLIDGQIIQGSYSLNYTYNASALLPSMGFLRSHENNWQIDIPDGNGIFLFNRGIRNFRIDLNGANIVANVTDSEMIYNGSKLYFHVFGNYTRYAIPVNLQSTEKSGKILNLLIDPKASWIPTYVRAGYSQSSVYEALRNAEFVGFMLLNVDLKTMPKGFLDLSYFEVTVDQEKLGKFSDLDPNSQRPNYCVSPP